MSESEQEIQKRATETMLLLESEIDIFISEIKLLTAQIELSEIDEDCEAELILRRQKLYKIYEQNQFEKLKIAVIQNPRNYSLVSLHLNPAFGEEEVFWIGENA